MIIVTVWILTADQVAQESGKEELATQYHSDERNVEVWGVGNEMTIYAMVEVDALVDAQADEREEADEEYETAQESEYVHWLLAEVAEEPEGHQVEIGGEIVVNGNSEKLQPWRIGINKPTDDSLNTNQAIQDVVSVSNIAMATSGNYRNFYYKNGKKYAHTIDPKTGYPVQHNILSATVFANDCATADAYATSFMVLGLDGAKKILEKHPELCAYLIYSDQKGSNQIWYSPSLQKKLGK